MSRDQDELLERVSKCIETMQKVHNDSRTPLNHAEALVKPIRDLDRCRDALRKAAFESAASEPKFNEAVSKLTIINNTLKADVMAYDKTLNFTKDAAFAATAVLDFAIAIGALVA